MIELTDAEFYRNKTWEKPLKDWDSKTTPDSTMVDIFDQNGYRLTPLEQLYSQSNKQLYVLHGDEKSLRKVWMTCENSLTGPHLNHSFLFERKGYEGKALEQLKHFAKENNLVYKLINYKGKWGVDFSMDYVDENGNSLELLHFEYDAYELEEILVIKQDVEQIVLGTDWTFAAKRILARKSEWINLEFFEQSKWKTDFFGLPAERFKVNAWE